jgi:hypothetical protein
MEILNQFRKIFIQDGHPAAQPSEQPAIPQLNISQGVYRLAQGSEAASLIWQLERTSALFNFVQRCTDVRLDRKSGAIHFDIDGNSHLRSLLQIGVEVYLNKDNCSKLRLATRSALRDTMHEHHRANVEGLLCDRERLGSALSWAGVVTTHPPTKPYSRAGKEGYLKLPETVQHGDYQFFVPGLERAAMVQLLAGICPENYVLLPAICLNREMVDPNSNVSVRIQWHLVALGEQVKAELLERGDPLDSFHRIAYKYRNYLSRSSFDLSDTVTHLANYLGLSIVPQDQEYPGGPDQFLISGRGNDKQIIVFIDPPNDKGQRALHIGWANQVRSNL